MDNDRMILIMEEYASAIFEINKMAVSLQSRIRDIINLLKTEGIEEMDGTKIMISDELSAALYKAGYKSLSDIQTAASNGSLGQKDGLTPKETEELRKILDEYASIKPGPMPAGKSNKGGLV
ncbi:MAG: hypothetical protein WC312_07875 [Candidatus Omnitrophota bacterium]|jgi:hypothetical protein